MGLVWFCPNFAKPKTKSLVFGIRFFPLPPVPSPAPRLGWLGFLSRQQAARSAPPAVKPTHSDDRDGLLLLQLLRLPQEAPPAPPPPRRRRQRRHAVQGPAFAEVQRRPPRRRQLLRRGRPRQQQQLPRRRQQELLREGRGGLPPPPERRRRRAPAQAVRGHHTLPGPERLRLQGQPRQGHQEALPLRGTPSHAPFSSLPPRILLVFLLVHSFHFSNGWSQINPSFPLVKLA